MNESLVLAPATGLVWFLKVSLTELTHISSDLHLSFGAAAISTEWPVKGQRWMVLILRQNETVLILQTDFDLAEFGLHLYSESLQWCSVLRGQQHLVHEDSVASCFF